LSPWFLLTVLGLLFFGELLVHPASVLYSGHSDLLAMHLPMKRFLVRSWQETGEIPLWCPHSFAGMPFVHDVQVAAFYPLHWPLYLLPEERIGAALSWLVVLHVLIAGWCMAAYARHRELGAAAAFVAALGYMFAGKWLLHVLAGGHYIMVPLAWLPLVLLWMEQALARHSFLHATGAGMVFALIVLGTHPQMTLYAGVFIALWFLCSLQEKRPSVLLRWLGYGLWTALIAAALSAVQLLPAMEAAGEASRAVGVAPGDILAVAWPGFLGLIGPGWTPSWEDRAGFGVLWLAAALTAAVGSKGRERYEVYLCLFLLFFSLGGAVLFQWLPGFRFFQLPIRMLMMLAMPVALFAGRATQFMLDVKLEPIASPRRGKLPACPLAAVGKLAACPYDPTQHALDLRSSCWQVLRGLVLLAIALAGLTAIGDYQAWRQASSSEIHASFIAWLRHLDRGALAYWGILLITAPLGFWLLNPRCPLPRRVWVAGWISLLLVDSWAMTWPHVAVREESEIYALSPSVRYLAQQRREDPGERWRVLDRGLPGCPSSTPLGSALPMLGTIQLEPVLGYNSFDVRRYKEYLQFLLDEDRPIRPREGVFGYPIIDRFPIKNKALLDLLGVRYLLQPREAVGDFPERGEPGATDRWRTIDVEDSHATAYSFLAGGVQQLPPYTLYENRDSFPRVFVVHRARQLGDPAQALRQLKATDSRREVLLEGAREWEEMVPPTEEEDRVAATIRVYQPNRVVVETHSARAGYLVLTDVWFPGWRCTVDGEPTRVHRANYLFRATAVPAGRHQVVFRFDPASYRWGKSISLIALAGVALVSLGCLVRRWWARDPAWPVAGR
jgi:hypothetical protein